MTHIRLYGITVYQAYKYYTVYADDGIPLKIYVRSISLFMAKMADVSPQIMVILYV